MTSPIGWCLCCGARMRARKRRSSTPRGMSSFSPLIPRRCRLPMASLAAGPSRRSMPPCVKQASQRSIGRFPMSNTSAESRSQAMDTIGIVGAGTMGNGIAYVAASHGHAVVMYDVQLTLAQRGFDAIRAILQRHVDKQRIDPAEMQATLARVRLTADLGDMARAAVVIEAVPE